RRQGGRVHLEGAGGLHVDVRLDRAGVDAQAEELALPEAALLVDRQDPQRLRERQPEQAVAPVLARDRGGVLESHGEQVARGRVGASAAPDPGAEVLLARRLREQDPRAGDLVLPALRDAAGHRALREVEGEEVRADPDLDLAAAARALAGDGEGEDVDSRI